ncbi:MAG: hypothetical protein WCI73_16310, partial [Phycisphaerae bacterium]
MRTRWPARSAARAEIAADAEPAGEACTMKVMSVPNAIARKGIPLRTAATSVVKHPPFHRHTALIPLLTALLLALTLSPVIAANYPGWWANRGVVDVHAAITSDYAVCTSGQLKWMALQAMYELDATLPGGAGSTVSNMVNAWLSNTANAEDYSAINAGQLKSVSAPFYDRLKACHWPCLLPDGMTTNQDYPWSGSISAAQDYSMANNGQVKYVFSFTVVNLNLHIDSSNQYGTAVPPPDAGVDAIKDLDGSTNYPGKIVFMNDM